MRFRNLIIFYITASILLCTGFNFKGIAQFSKETGFFPITNFSPEDYNNAMPQNNAIIQDQRGIMYFGNDEGILEYDGIKWRVYNVTNETAVKSLAIDKNGRIYVGAIDEFGYLLPNENGDLEYISLVGYLDDSLKKFQEIWYIHATSDGIYFQTSEYIFLWDNKEIKYWKAHSHDKKFHTSFLVNDRFIVNRFGSGLYILENNELKKLKNTEIFESTVIYSMIPLGDNSFLTISKSNGFFKVKFNETMDEIDVSRIGKNLKKTLKDYILYNAVKISDNTYSIGTWGSGLLIYQNGSIVKLITRESGINNEVIVNQYLDKDNNLWLALTEGITKIEINSPLTKFTKKLGIEGNIESIARFNNKIYLATEKGLLYLPDKWYGSEKIYEQNKFVKLQKFQGGCWDVFNFTNNKEDFLLVAIDDGILQIDKSNKVERICYCSPWKMYQSKQDPNLIYIGLDNGLATLERKNGQWIFKDNLFDIYNSIFNLVEDNKGNLWLGTLYNGVIKIENPESENKWKINHFNTKNGLPKVIDTYTSFFQDDILFGTYKGIFKYNESSDSFIVANNLPVELTDSDWLIHRLKPDQSGNLWVSAFIQSQRKLKMGYLSYDDSEYKWNDTPFNTISKGDIHAIHFDRDSIVWIGGSDGLYRFNSKIEKDYKKDFASLIRLSIIGEDSTIFFGSYFDENGFVTTFQPEILKPELKYKYNSLNFEFSAQNPEIEHPVLFSYYLEGFDKEWSEWSERGFERYTNLNEGTYTFRVKAKDIYEHQSEEASYEFVILPPWYRTILAYILYVLTLVALVYIIVTQYTKYLRGVIKLKTKEIRRQKEIVEHKNEEITDSIKYAKRIQEALLPPKEILVESETDHFILFKPRDIVSGDFYWFRKIKDFIVIVAADCTGHGVPGAFVSMLGMAFLNEISVEIKEVKADKILNSLRALIIKSLRQTGQEGESKDGMDIALYVIDKKNMKLQFAGANNPLILIRNKELEQIKGDRMPIGFHLVMDEFKNNEIDIKKGDMLYTFSDGYQDQFGGEKGSKFMIKKLKRLMVEICEKPVEEQHQILDDTIEEWKGTEEQVDDVLLIGVRI